MFGRISMGRRALSQRVLFVPPQRGPTLPISGKMPSSSHRNRLVLREVLVHALLVPSVLTASGALATGAPSALEQSTTLVSTRQIEARKLAREESLLVAGRDLALVHCDVRGATAFARARALLVSAPADSTTLARELKSAGAALVGRPGP